MDGKVELLRHTVATLAYRDAKAMLGAPAEFAEYRSAPDSRTPAEILAHMGDLFDWALSMAAGKPSWHNSTPLEWEAEQQRFYAALQAFDGFLAGEEELQAPEEKLIQGPLADALTHVGQLATLRRMAGVPARGENFYVAKIAAGQVSAVQPAAVKPF